MRHNLCARLILVFITCIMPLSAQEPTLKGKVTPGEKPPPKLWGGVQIRVMNRSNNQEVEGEQRVTDDEKWYHVAPLGAHVDVLFDKACYVPDGRYDVPVKLVNTDLQPVQLQKTRECLIAERGQQRRHVRAASMPRSGATVGTVTPAPRADTAVIPVTPVLTLPSVITPMSQSAPQVSKTRAFTENESEEDPALFPSPKALKKQLEKEAVLARKGEFFDTFQYNFQVKWVVYGDVPALTEVLLQFRNDKQNQDLFKQVGDVAPEAFNDTILGQFEISDQLDFENIKRVVRDGAISPSVRGSATVAFLNVKPKLPEETVNDMMEYYRQQAQNSSSEIFAVSVVALARNGDSGDRAKLYEDIRTSTDEKRVIASIKALGVTQIIEGPEALPGGAQTLADVAKTGEDSSVRAAAFSALRPFAFRWDQTAITALLTGVRKDPSPEARFRAALSLGVGDLEDVSWVRKILRSVAKTDPSPFVRRAANLSLSGMRWFPRVIKRRL